ncbi:MAG: hypothetical protein [Caudoviricetes sp.]|nr:MAG: hypothetical protein [Caudoviricetes sp.]
MSKKVVVFNAPARSGKDEACKYLEEFLLFHGKAEGVIYTPIHKEFKGKLFAITREIFSVSKEEWDEHYTRELKETPWNKLNGLTPRQALIFVSEDIIKPNFSKTYFGESLAKSLGEGINVISDGGFDDEMIPIIQAVGKENILVVKIKRDGCSFEGDSRSFLNTDKLGIMETWVDNNNSLEVFFTNVVEAIEGWLNLEK